MPEDAEKQKPQIEAFEQKLAVIMGEARSKIEAVLSPEQKTKFADFQKQHPSAPRGGAPFLASPEPQFAGLFVYKPQVSRLVSELGLNPTQLTQVDAILKARRQAVLELLDSNPPPSAMLGRHPHYPTPDQGSPSVPETPM